jgi:hypothetical protein
MKPKLKCQIYLQMPFLKNKYMKRKKNLLFIKGIILLVISIFINNCSTNSKQQLKDEVNSRSLLQPLPLGEVKPQNWLKKQAELALNGLIWQQHLLDSNVWRIAAKTADDISPTMSWWPYEQQAYYIDGATRMAHVMDDKRLLDGLQPTFEAVIARQDNSGYYFSDDDRWRNAWLAQDKGTDHERWMETGFEGMHWSKGIFARAVLAHYKATGDERFKELLRKHFLNYYHKGRDADQIGKTINGLELYENLGTVTWESMVEYVRLTGDREVYERAAEIFANNEDGMVRNYLNGDFTTVCHGVVFNETTKLYAAGYILTGKIEYLEAVENLYAWVKENHLQPHGVISSHEFLKGIGGFQASETCNAAAYPWSNLWLLRASGKANYADRIEEAFYNAGQRMVAYDYKTHAYSQCPNSVPGISISHMNYKTEFKAEHRPICCTRNLTRVLPNFIGHLCMRTSSGGLAQVMYAPCIVTTTVGGQPIEYEVITDYPFNETVNISFLQSDEVKFPLLLRVPEWCSQPIVKVNGQNESFHIDENGFIECNRKWEKGDQLTLDLPMSSEIITGREKFLVDETGSEPLFLAHGESAHITTFKEGAPYAWIKRGPLAFSYPIETVEESGVALVLNNGQQKLQTQIEEIPENWTWGDKPPVTISALIQKINWKPIDGNPFMPDSVFPVDISRQKEVKFVPYGCSGTGRMTMLPVAIKDSERNNYQNLK